MRNAKAKGGISEKGGGRRRQRMIVLRAKKRPGRERLQLEWKQLQVDFGGLTAKGLLGW